MKHFIFICLLAFGLQALAQDEVPQAKEASPNLRARVQRRYARTGSEMWIYGGAGLSQASSNFDKSNRMENAATFNVAALYEMGRFTFSGVTGLEYFQEGVAGGTENTYIDETDGSVATSRSKFDAKLGFVGVPLVGRVNFLRSHRSRFHSGIGIMPAVLVDSHGRGEYTIEKDGLQTFESGSNMKQSDIRSTNLFALASVGGDIGLSSSQDMRVEFLYRRMVLDVSSKEPSGYFTNSFLLNFGFGFDL